MQRYIFLNKTKVQSIYNFEGLINIFVEMIEFCARYESLYDVLGLGGKGTPEEREKQRCIESFKVS
jgi:hypothetical protein